MFAQNFVNCWFFGVYATSRCQLLNNVSNSSSSSEFRSVPNAHPTIENIGSVDFVVDRKSPKTIMTSCNGQFKGKSQVTSGKASITKTEVEKDGTKPLEAHTKKDKKSEEIPLKRKMSKERGKVL